MTRKKYISPSMEIFELNTQNKLLFGSDLATIDATGLLGEGEEVIPLNENPESIWNEAW